MLKTSYLAATVFRGLAVLLRQTVAQSGEISTPTIAVPSGKTKVEALAELSPAHLVDPARTLTLIFERSSDGVNWTAYGSAAIQGVAGRTRAPGLGTETPPPGTFLRTRIVAGAQSVNSGLAVTSS